MNHAIFSLYRECFPAYPIDRGVFDALVTSDQAQLIKLKDGSRLAGYSVVCGNSIALLCVAEAYRNNGIGGTLLRLSERHIAASGADKILLGRGADYIFQGVPEDCQAAVPFFSKRGYNASWSSVNMVLETADFDAASIALPPCPPDIRFRLARKSDRESLHAAVMDAQPEWNDYFTDIDEPVVIAERGGEVLGFEILSPDGGRFNPTGGRMGSIGCVGVVHAARQLGIGRRMVCEGIERLREQGCEAVELLYVYLVDWYAKLGFAPVCHQWMGEKALNIRQNDG